MLDFHILKRQWDGWVSFSNNHMNPIPYLSLCPKTKDHRAGTGWVLIIVARRIRVTKLITEWIETRYDKCSNLHKIGSVCWNLEDWNVTYVWR